ncbi:acyl-CoA N-acyltransferase [Artomyces pyxidatus]|uniref:Acyl-CoA N-acyltransferase n=1 Tax=Artomyces pyxidatus TaxID=48021 RepID=A0ACB8TAE3_9AGAM|nr:acyl-CoA N-acyltransferase [Artomyces pyxidatus]
MQACNLQTLPSENNPLHYYVHHMLTWPSLTYVAEDARGRIVGYVIARMVEDAAGAVYGHLRALSVLRSYRRLGLARKLVLQCQEAMRTTYRAAYVALNVRKTNRAAFGLYHDALGFAVHEARKQFYANGEDAYAMRFSFEP